MKRLLFQFSLIFLIVGMVGSPPALLASTNDFIAKHCIYEQEDDCSLLVENAPANDEELIQKVKSALLTIYDEKKLKFGDFNVDKSDKEITVNVSAELYKEDVSLSSTFTTDKKLLSIAGKFQPGSSPNNKNFKKITTDNGGKNWFPKAIQKNIQVDNIQLSFDEASQKISELKIAVSTTQGWTMIKQGALKLNSVAGSLTIKNPTGAKSASASLGGSFNIGSTKIATTANVGSSSANWSFTGELENLSITNVIKSVVGSLGNAPMPNNFTDASIVKSSFTIIPASKKFSLDGTGAIGGQELGDLEMRISSGSGNSSSLNFLVGISPSASFKMAKIDPSLKMLDDLAITNFGLVLSSSASASTSLKVFERLGANGEVGRGLNFIGAFDLTAVDMDKLLGLNSIMLRAVVSSNLSDLLLEASINTSIPLGEVATFKKIKFKLKPSPANFKISMGGDMEVKVDKDILLFKTEVGVDVTDQALFVDGKVVGMWNEPFGVKGLSIGDLWIYLDLSFRTTPIPLPAIGIAGKLKANEFEGDLALVMNTNNPSESAIDAGFNEIDLKAILETYCDKQTLNSIPPELKNTVLDVTMKDVRLTVVPRPMTINTKSYDAGFRAKGAATIGDDLSGMLDVNIGYDGIDATAGMDKISHQPYFELAGAQGKENPSLRIVAKKSEAKVAISGSATLLGLTREADLMLNDKGFDLFIGGKIFNAFEADLAVSGSRVTDGGSFSVKATMKQDFLSYFTKYASEEIDKATEQTQNDIKKAQDEITSAQKEVAKLEGEINVQRSVVQKERDRDLNNMKAAEQELANARKGVNKLQGDINAAHKVIADTKAKIKAKDDWINSGSVFEVPIRGTESIPFFAEQGAILTAKAAEIAAFETAKGTANVALLGAQKSMEGFRYIGELTPVDLDPRVSSLITAKESSITVMEGAKIVLEGGKIVGVGTLQASKWIVENGPGGVVNITEASFEAKLSMADGGTITLHVKGTFAGEPLDEKFTFNFNNPLDEVVKFAEGLL